MIQFLSVSKNFDDNLFSLQDLSFEIQEGEFVFLVGPSGSGKTSIIKLLIREEKPSSGKIFFEDEDVTRFNRNKVYQLRRRIGVIFQDFKLINEMNAYENIAFAMEAAGKPDREIKENVPYLLDIVGLGHRARSFPYQLSGGEKQRVAIARAMANNPRLLIADEPTGNLDPETAWDIAQILYKINNWGTTVIMSTHGSDIVNSMHKRVIRLQEGKIVRDDFKGSYEDIDEFSLKIINNGAAAEPAGRLQSKRGQPKAGIDDIATTPAKPVVTPEAEQPKKKLHQSGKKISFSTKSSKAPVTAVPEPETAPEINTEVATLASGDAMDAEAEEQLESETRSGSVADLDLSEDLQKKLLDLGYTNLEQIVARGVNDLHKKDHLTDGQLKELSKFIKSYLDK